jgi:hypothetical protein
MAFLVQGGAPPDDSVTTVKIKDDAVTAAKVAAGVLPAKNLIINGDMRISQRSDEASVTGNSYGGPDRFQMQASSHGTWTVGSTADAPTGEGFTKCQHLTCTSGGSTPGVGDLAHLVYKFEGQDLQSIKKGSSNAEPLTLSFWVKSDETGTAIVELQDSDNTRHVSASYTIGSADTWEQKIITFPADTTGTFNSDNAQSAILYWWLDGGTNYTSGTLATTWASLTQANRAVGLNLEVGRSTSDYLKITGVQLEVGSAASDFEHRDYATELARCQRYFQTTARESGAVCQVGSGYAEYGNRGKATRIYPVEMRSAPTVTVSAVTDLTFRTTAGGFTGASGFAVTNISRQACHLDVVTASSLTDGQGGVYEVAAGTAKFINFSAEL